MTQILFKNFKLLEPAHGELRGGYELLVEGDRVRECSDTPIRSPDAVVVDCGGQCDQTAFLFRPIGNYTEYPLFNEAEPEHKLRYDHSVRQLLHIFSVRKRYRMVSYPKCMPTLHWHMWDAP